jgi:hypothetical protein
MKGLNTQIVKNFFFPLPSTFKDQIAIANELEKKLTEAEGMRIAAELQWEAVSALPGAILREVFDFEK